MRFEASAPSNIALIKYMGKTSADSNLPANSSLSLTLENLRSFVVIEPCEQMDQWQPLNGFPPLQLSQTGRGKFLKHLDRLKRHWNVEGFYRILSANNFPADCGLASSASSFAALTLATYNLAQSQNSQLSCSLAELSALSRLGSGSSCRSFFSPWSEWSNEGAGPCELNLKLEHAVVLVDGTQKSVSSSEAHRRVVTSQLWTGRPERANFRLDQLKSALQGGDWHSSFEICWNEFWDMHTLFETSQPAFGYMTAQTMAVLEKVRQIWHTQQDGPLVTMDAGANVHLLFRPDQLNKADEWLQAWRVMRSWNE